MVRHLGMIGLDADDIPRVMLLIRGFRGPQA